MADIKTKRNHIVGYMGYLPSNQQDQHQNFSGVPDSQIPGYVGYIPAVKSENLYAKTYGKITENCSKGNYYRGIELPTDVKYVSTTKDTYVHPNLIKQQETGQGKICGVKASTFSNAAKWMIDTQSNKKQQEFEVHSKLTYQQACKKAYK